METICRLNTEELGISFDISLKDLFQNQEKTITVKSTDINLKITDEDQGRAILNNEAFDFLDYTDGSIYSLEDGITLFHEK